MAIDQIVALGDKIDIQLVQQLEQVNNDPNTAIRTYKSSLFEALSNKEIEIAMPTENGRMVLFQTGLRIKMFFYTKKGLYTCTGVVQKRYKKENFFMLLVLLNSEPVKFQRREFYRIEQTIDFKYIEIDEALVQKSTTEEILNEMHGTDALNKAKGAITSDISGGGIRFVGNESLAKDSYVLAIIRLTTEKTDQTLYLIVQVIDSFQSTKNVEKMIIRGRFIFKDLKDREAIVRYIFEEERRLRRKEMGS